MLKTMRENTKTLIWITIIIFILFTVIGTALSTRAHKAYAAVIFGKKISIQMYKTFYDIVFYSPRFQQLINGSQNVPESFIMNTALQYIALYLEAKRKHIRVSDADVRNEIMRRYSIDGVFNKNIYEMHVRNVMRKKIRDYEENVRKELMIDRLLESFRSAVTISPKEARSAFNLENSSYTLSYFIIAANHFKNSIAFDEETLRNFYNNHKAAFAVPEKYDFEYLHFTPDKYRATVSVTESEIENYYDQNTRRFTDESGTVKSLDDVKSSIEKTLKERKAKTLMLDDAERAQQVIRDTKNFDQGAQQTGTKAQRAQGKSADDLLQLFGWTPDFYNKLPDMSPNSLRIIQTTQGAFVLLLTDKEYTYTPAFETIVDKVKEQYVKQEAQQRAQGKAEELYNQISAGTIDLKTAAQTVDASVEQITDFSLKSGMTDTTLGNPVQLMNTLKDFSTGDIPPPYPVDGGSALIQVDQRTLPSDAEFAAQQKAFDEKLLSTKQRQVTLQDVNELLTRAKIQNKLVDEENPFANITDR